MSITVTTSGGSSQIAVNSSNVIQNQTQRAPYTDDYLKGYIQTLFDEHATDVENLTVWEMADTYFWDEPTEEEFDRIFKLMREADVEVVVTW